jgi:nucleotide-binding universal stress UspA family protein
MAYSGPVTFNLYLPLTTYPDAVEERDIEAVVAVAQHLGASVTGAGVEVDIPDLKNKLAEALIHLQDKIRAVERTSHAHAERLLATLVRLGKEGGVTVTAERFRAHPAFLDEAIVRHSRFHDMVVLPLPKDDMTAVGTAEALVFGCGRPVLLLPPSDKLPGNLGTVILATDFGRVATRAMFDAHPSLMRAEKVYAVTVTDEKEVSHGNRAALAAHFERHGLPFEPVDLQAKGTAAGEVLQNFSDGVGAGLMVMGAFGHSRVREFVLGGVTSTVLYNIRHPVLMSY